MTEKFKELRESLSLNGGPRYWNRWCLEWFQRRTRPEVVTDLLADFDSTRAKYRRALRTIAVERNPEIEGLLHATLIAMERIDEELSE